MTIFVGRRHELTLLDDLYTQGRSSLVVIKGRRRIGKSRLVTEFAKNKHLIALTALPPSPALTDQDQRDHFALQISRQLGIASPQFTDWSEAFYYLSDVINHQGAVILFDEISWMGLKDPTFVPKLKVWWDVALAPKSNIMLVFCGSVSTWIEENIIKSTAFFGRISLSLTLEPLTLPESARLLRLRGFKGSPYEIYKILSVTGGVPWYLEQIDPHLMADRNIKRLCFDKNGLLVGEFDHIFHDLFNGRGSVYKKILETLHSGMKSLKEIRSDLGFAASGSLSHWMENLIISGFVSKHTQWSLKTTQPRKQSLYRLSDPYLRFYLTMIEPHRDRIHQGYYDPLELRDIPGFDSIMGLQIETVLLQNRPLLLESIGVNPAECVYDNPYRQQATQRKKGCQIDYLVQTLTRNLYLCEFKFKRRDITTEIIDQIQKKMDALSIPRGFALVPVLFHISDVTDQVWQQRFFYRIVDITGFLEE